jgi:ubiquinone/menaquinone biosynthesis C-methylase UbiE
MLSRGDTRGRRYIEVPTGHMLKTSTEALETFELVTAEVSRMALGTEIRGARPDLAELDRRSRAERERLPRRDEDLQGFWRDYLVGRNGALGFELMTSISPYEELMEQQVQALQLVPGMTVADLGSGTGAFPMHVAQQLPDPESLRILSVDYVSDALQRGRQRLATQERVPSVAYVTANLDTRRGGISFPIAAESVDAILGALFLSYVKDPVAVLREMRGILRPGGRLVVSTLRRDADMSKLYMEGLEELAARGLGDLDAGDGSEELDALCRDYFSQAARLLDLEEQGTFRFYDDEEIQKLLVEAGFTDVTSLEALGDPPQAIVAAGIKAGTGALSRS